MDRRQFLASSAACGALSVLRLAKAESTCEVSPARARADAMIMIYLPGGVAQQDTWDPKPFTPYRAGMKGSELLSTCRTIRTAADPISIGEGLEQISTVMGDAALIRSLETKARFGASHVKAQFYSMTGYLEPVGLKPPSIGSIVSRTLGQRDANVPAYIYIGRDINPGSNVDRQKAIEFTGPGFYGNAYAPFRVADPSQGLATLHSLAGMTPERIDRRIAYLKSISRQAQPESSATAEQYLKVIEDARKMMDSPVKRAFNYLTEESPETIRAYEPQITAAEVQDKSYYHGTRFGHGLLLARRLIESGARYVQVEMMYDAFKGFDMHDGGGVRMTEMKKQIDGPIAQLIRDLKQRGLLDRTLVCIESEFGRTIASAPAHNFGGKAGAEPIGATEEHDGTDLVIQNESMYGFHGHFSTNHTVVLFGGGVKGGTVYGKTADRHPMLPVENAVELPDIHATLFHALGIPADHSYVTESRPFYVTKDGKGRVIDSIFA